MYVYFSIYSILKRKCNSTVLRQEVTKRVNQFIKETIAIIYVFVHIYISENKR